MEKIHIGKMIKEKFKESNLSIAEFADLLNYGRTNIYRIFQRQSINTELLYKISDVLRYDFMNYYLLNEQKKEDIIQITIEINNKQITIYKTTDINIIIKDE